MKLNREPNASWRCNIAVFDNTWMRCIDGAIDTGFIGIVFDKQALTKRYTEYTCARENGVFVLWISASRGDVS